MVFERCREEGIQDIAFSRRLFVADPKAYLIYMYSDVTEKRAGETLRTVNAASLRLHGDKGCARTRVYYIITNEQGAYNVREKCTQRYTTTIIRINL